MTRTLALFLTVIFIGCASSPPVSPEAIPPLFDAKYQPYVDRNTISKKAYDGFYNTFQASMTLLTSELAGLLLQRRGHFLQWDTETAREEREKMFQENSSYSKAFLAFFSPENDYDDLNDPDSIWKVYLVHQGTRYQGQVKKDKSKFVELKEIYPHFNRFSTPYIVTFNVPMTAIENDPITIILTSSLGQAEFEFNQN